MATDCACSITGFGWVIISIMSFLFIYAVFRLVEIIKDKQKEKPEEYLK